MRVALVSPYSWTYPGGVTRHIEALAHELSGAGHDVRVLAPFDPDTRRAGVLHRGARPQPRPVPDFLDPLGPTVGVPSNGAVSNLAIAPQVSARLRRALRDGAFDVVHLHEPVAPLCGWEALTATRAPLVGTFHCYSENRAAHAVAVAAGARRKLNHLKVRIAVSEAAAWTGRRFYGGEYRVIPNGVQVPTAMEPGETAPRAVTFGPDRPLRLAFVGQVVERKGLPVLLRAFEALRDRLPVELTLVGVDAADVATLLDDRRGITALGRVDDAAKVAAVAAADVLVAPSLGGESFGMVLTEAFAVGTPVVASDIPGYRDVVADGRTGLLVPPGDPSALAGALRDLAFAPTSLARMGEQARAAAESFAWPRVAERVLGAYEDAIAIPDPAGRATRAAVRVGVRPADGGPRRPAERLPTLHRPLDAPAKPRRTGALVRRGGLALAALAVVGLSVEAVRRVGVRPIADALLASSPPWVLLALAVMCASMLMRAVAWRAILAAAVRDVPVRMVDAVQGTCIGVLMSATLPARLGEPSRAVIVARRLGRPRERLPVVLGSIVSQTILNVLALVVLGGIVLSTVGMFAGRQGALAAFALVPALLVAFVLGAPTLLGPAATRSARIGRVVASARRGLGRVRAGLLVFRTPRHAAVAVGFQFGAWFLQCLSCYLLFVALGLDERGAGIGAAAAVLFAVNVTAVLPLTPSNLGVFQAACVAVLGGAYAIPAADALGFGIILQAVEIATAVTMGAPALVKEGVSWRDVRMRAMHTAPVSLPQRRVHVLEAEAQL